MRAAFALALSCLAACGGTAPRTCSASFEGNFGDHTATLTNCPRVEHDAASGGSIFKFSVASPAGATTDKGTIELGANAVATSLASANTAGWEASASREPGCVYSAGNEAIPTGSFTLELASVDTASGEATGTLELRQSLHAQPMTDCGPGDEEVLRLSF